MAKQTSYSNYRNLLILISFNQKVDPVNIQPITIETKLDAITDEGAILPVVDKQVIGDLVKTSLSNDDLYKQVYAISPVLAKGLANILQLSLEQDVSKVDVSQVETLTSDSLKAPGQAQPTEEMKPSPTEVAGTIPTEEVKPEETLK